ncbi:MAG: FmdC precursor [Cyclobacteriaceae bacterium]
MNKSFIFSFLFIGILSLAEKSNAQIPIAGSLGKGIRMQAVDSSFAMKFSFRFQSLYSGQYTPESETWNESFLIRRSRLKFDGYVFNPKVIYKVELGLSNSDTQGPDEMGRASNMILDAVVKWRFAPKWYLWAGQAKLPGNRERVISSQDLQFVDRSLVNSEFNIDRDIGVQLRTNHRMGSMVVRGALAISMGEGRGVLIDNPKNGREYTARVELLPFGKFTSKGDYFGSDLAREASPKLSIGATYDYNHQTPRSRGNLGSFLTDSTGSYIFSDLSTVFIDAVFKYKGLSWSSEYANKRTDAPVDGFGYGSGSVTSLGYLMKSNVEVAGRYTEIAPNHKDFTSITGIKEYTLGISRYVVGHALKVQSDFSWVDNATSEDFFRVRVQFEVAL